MLSKVLLSGVAAAAIAGSYTVGVKQHPAMNVAPTALIYAISETHGVPGKSQSKIVLGVSTSDADSDVLNCVWAQGEVQVLRNEVWERQIYAPLTCSFSKSVVGRATFWFSPPKYPLPTRIRMIVSVMDNHGGVVRDSIWYPLKRK